MTGLAADDAEELGRVPAGDGSVGHDPARVLVVNAGSSSLKLSLLDHDDTVLGSANLPAEGGAWDPGSLAAELDRWPAPDAIGHRVVHGGTEFVAPVRIDDKVLDRLRALTDLAPLHQPKSLAGIDALRRVLPGVPAVACFDTAFHSTLPEVARTYAIPAEWRQRFGLRRYGFHGLSHAYASRRAAQLTGARRIVVAHLGAGASLCAVLDGRSVDTTMGFTPLEGLVMATRSGSLDPGMLLWLNTHAGIPVAELADALEHRSGLLGLAGTADLREIVERDDSDARLALGVYIHRLCREIAAMTVSLGGLDALVFTGGVGEHSPVVRRRAVDGLGFLGLRLSEERNAEVDGDSVLNGTESLETVKQQPRIVVVTAREDLEIARGTRHALS